MKKLVFLFFFLIAFQFHASTQTFSYPTINKTGRTLQDFTPTNWVLKDSDTGDLNGDKLDDEAFVIEYKDSVRFDRDNIGKPRILVIIFKDSIHNNYRLVLQNNTFILSTLDEGTAGTIDPYGWVRIYKKGILDILFQFTRGCAEYKFRYQNNSFCLIGASNNGVSGGEYDDWDFNFLTKKAKHHTGSIGDDKGQTECIPFKLDKLKTLQEFKELMQWEVVPNGFI